MLENVDIVVGCSFGDEAKGKITNHLAGTGDYNIVARWAGGNNAGHTVYKDGKKYKTHLVPTGVFFGVTSLVGPGCVLHPKSFLDELSYLKSNGFDTSLVKVDPRCHIVLDEHIAQDKEMLAKKLGTTSKGIAPVYASKAARTGVLAKDILSKELLWTGKLEGTLLCEGAQGFWLDIDHGNYPYVTSSVTLPYGACSLGFPPQKIRNIYGAAKIYDTRSGEDPLFPASLLEHPELSQLAKLGKEFGVTTGRARKADWLNLDRLIHACSVSGVTHLVVSKCDVMQEFGTFKLVHLNEEKSFGTLKEMLSYAESELMNSCMFMDKISFSYSPERI